ncbi:MAG: hypothetical protein M0D55_15945 [Elusimicrobiota bacterium]|nr:MAG: hypothetical protein M0D55_15945 [Elusimicrobiota bacterium]
MHAIFPAWYIVANCLLLIPVAVAGGILGSSPYLQARFSAELILLFYSWIAGFYLMRPFTSTLLFAIRNTLAHASQHIAGIIAWPLIISPLPFLVAFLFAWLAGGSWTKRAVQTWAVVMIASLPKGASGGATLVSFFAYALFSLFLPGVMHLAAALFGSWLACRGFTRKYLEPARNAFLQSALLPR